MDKEFLENYQYIISFISPRIREYLAKISDNNKQSIQEIRLRKGRPIVIVNSNGSCFLNNNSKLTYINSNSCVIPDENEIIDTVNKMCHYSFHSHSETLSNGYISLPNGSRVGVVGTAVMDGKSIKSIKDITSVNIRISRNIKNISDEIINHFSNKGLKNIIIVGPPNSGKTTMLRDIAFQLSSGNCGKYFKVAVIDERKEIILNENNAGYNTDVLYGYPKAEGMSIAIRTLSPDCIICDEIANSIEAKNITDYINTGVKFIVSIHADNFDELKNKPLFKILIKNGFNDLVVLNDSKQPGTILNISKVVIKDNDFIVNNNYSEFYYSDSLDRAN